MILVAAKLGIVFALINVIYALPAPDMETMEQKEQYQNFLDDLYANQLRESAPLPRRPLDRQELINYIRGLEMELLAENGGGGYDSADSGMPVVGPMAPADAHSVDKRRRRRYGFWVTAINKMGN